MNDVELRQACEEWIQRLMFPGTVIGTHFKPSDKDLSLVLAFARRMQAVGVRSVKACSSSMTLESPIDAWDAGYEVALKKVADWCEAEAKRLEGKNA